jgi:hypothetical protein
VSQDLQTCRFCGQHDYRGTASMVKYGVRHYAHFACYLDAGKRLDDLHAWQVGTFPFGLLRDRGLLDEVEALMAPKLEPLPPGELLRIVRGAS